MVTVEELEGWLQEVCTNLRHVLRHERRDSAARLTEQAKAYIEEHYKESDLSARQSVPLSECKRRLFFPQYLKEKWA